jgi:protein SCO1/2
MTCSAMSSVSASLPTHHANKEPTSPVAWAVRFIAIIVCWAVSSLSVADQLPHIGPAPTFELTAQDGETFALEKVRDRVTVVTFIFTRCKHMCPLLMAKLMEIHRQLGEETSEVFFVAISVDPEHDSPDVLKEYAAAYSAPSEDFAFLTGDVQTIQKVVSGYGAYFKQGADNDVDHTFLTSVVDRERTLRVQYMGWRFNPDEFLEDLRSVVQEGEPS